ncbi:NUDIX hydrolase [Rhodanobacter sp. FW102-FHT14D06]|uniref:NUDIX hydrolase n=2 Tax=unclassified Rhodanobacter TaxID=2621553 RepID=A0AB74UZ58_9GAMM
MGESASSLIQALRRYRDQWQGDADVVAQFEDFAQTHADAFERSNPVAHFTGSAWLVSADGGRVLLMHHRKLDRWLQPGGHADGDTDLGRVALREAEEETGLTGLRIDGDIFDIDRHRIAARGNEPEHWHYDVRYVVHGGADESFVVNAESHALAWRPVNEVAADETLDASLRRMARKWLMKM